MDNGLSNLIAAHDLKVPQHNSILQRLENVFEWHFQMVEEALGCPRCSKIFKEIVKKQKNGEVRPSPKQETVYYNEY